MSEILVNVLFLLLSLGWLYLGYCVGFRRGRAAGIEEVNAALYEHHQRSWETHQQMARQSLQQIKDNTFPGEDRHV